MRKLNSIEKKLVYTLYIECLLPSTIFYVIDDQ